MTDKIPERWLVYMMLGMPAMMLIIMFPPVFPYTLIGFVVILYCFFCLFMMVREYEVQGC